MKDIIIAYHNPVDEVFSLFRPSSPPYSMIRISGGLMDLKNFSNIQHYKGGIFFKEELIKYNLTYRIID